MLLCFYFLQRKHEMHTLLSFYYSIYLLLLFHQILLGQYKIKYYGEEEHHCYAVFGEDGADNLREDGEHAGGLCEAKTDAERQTYYNHVALREACTCHHAESGEENATEHHDGATAENGLRNGGEGMTDSREHATENHNNGSNGDGKAVYDARNGCKTDVLAERCDWSTTENARHRTYETVTTNG